MMVREFMAELPQSLCQLADIPERSYEDGEMPYVRLNTRLNVLAL